MKTKNKTMKIGRVNQEEKNWNILFQQIVKGNVIPIIGPEIVRIEGKSSAQFLIDSIADACEIEENLSTFSQLVYHKCYKNTDLGEIHDLLTDIINAPENADYFEGKKDNQLLYRLLSIPYFPFVITTTFDPIVENVMKQIHKDKNVRILTFRNNSTNNDDIENELDAKCPTLYYMFGKADGKAGSFVVTDRDLLRFSQAWMLPNDSSSGAKPSNLSNMLANRYLLVVGNNYHAWLFRFFWFMMKNESGIELPKEQGMKQGMLAHAELDKDLINFLNHFGAFTQMEPDMNRFVEKLEKGTAEAEKVFNVEENNQIPEEGTDVFISYSRGDSALVEEIYKILKEHGLKVWYDRKSLHKGLDFMRQIGNAIKNSTFFVPVLTNTIIKQAGKEHPYRLEWKHAVEHIQLTGGIQYCFPFYEEDFDMDNLVAAIPDDLKRHDAYCFSRSNLHSKINELAKTLIELKNKRTDK